MRGLKHAFQRMLAIALGELSSLCGLAKFTFGLFAGALL
jgi:hypothetical protein